MDTAPGNTSYCERCGRELTAADPAPMCAQCAVEVADGRACADAAARAAAPARPDRAERIARFRARAFPVLAVVLGLVLIVRIPALARAFAPAAPVHEGSVATDATGDRCVGNLWRIAQAMSEQRTLRPAPACPASDKPYLTTREDAVTIVACPSPDAHGVQDISVRSDSLVPAVR